VRRRWLTTTDNVSGALAEKRPAAAGSRPLAGDFGLPGEFNLVCA